MENHPKDNFKNKVQTEYDFIRLFTIYKRYVIIIDAGIKKAFQMYNQNNLELNKVFDYKDFVN